MSSRFLVLLTVASVLVGCESANNTAAVVVAPAGEAETVEPQPTLTATVTDPAVKTAQPPAAEYHPPFPARTELFSPPQGIRGTVRRDEEHGETIELKGFVDVNGPQVVLDIDGVISPIPAGGEKYGVQVISIDPPHVVLQRGRNRWTASLE